MLDEAFTSRSPVSALLEAAQGAFDLRDGALLRELVLGTLRWRLRLDCVLSAASSRRIRKIDRKLLALLRLAAYQLLYLDRVPAYAAVNEAVDEARRRAGRRAAGFVNGVLRKIAASPTLEAWPVVADNPTARLARETSHPEQLVRRWMKRFGAGRAERLLAANNRPAPLQLLAFRDRGGAADLAARLEAEGVRTEPALLSPLGLVVRDGDALGSEALRRGDAYVQDQASQAVALIPAPGAGERILDAAAAPGGKAFAALAWEPAARVFAADVSPARLSTLRQNARRLGRSLPMIAADAARPALRPLFDRVVLDLPCSGTGTLRRHPELKWRFSESEIARLSRQAEALLEGAASLVAEGGLLVASTCSLEPEENEELVARFLRQRREFAPVSLTGRLEPALAQGIAGPGLWQVLTDGDHDGFTVSVVRRSVGG